MSNRTPVLAGIAAVIIVYAIMRSNDRNSEPAAFIAQNSARSVEYDYPHDPERPIPNRKLSNAERLRQDLLYLLSVNDEALTNISLTSELMELLQSDPNAANVLLEGVEDSTCRERLIIFLSRNWTGLNSGEVLVWARQLTNSTERESVVKQVCFEIARTDAAKAIEVVERELPDDHAQWMLRDLAKDWAAKDLDAALAWVAMRPEGENRDGLFSELALAAAEVSPEKAARIVSDRISPGTVQASAALSVLDQWAQIDFSAAADWANSFPAGQTRDHAMLHLGRKMFYQSQRPLPEAQPSD